MIGLELMAYAVVAAAIVQGAAEPETPPTERSRSPEEVCRLARAIAESEPCVRSDDCQALDLWRELAGDPGAFRARPSGRLRGFDGGAGGMLPPETSFGGVDCLAGERPLARALSRGAAA